MGVLANSTKSFEGKLKIAFLVEWIVYLVIAAISCVSIGPFIQDMINQSLAPSPTSDIFVLWKDPPIHPTLKVYLFNITNLDPWLKGVDSVLNFQEVGPYAYRETWRKTNVRFHRYNILVSLHVVSKNGIFL